MLESSFFVLLDRIMQGAGVRQENFLQSARDLYGLTHAAYLGINIPNPTHGSYYAEYTYSSEWAHRYVEKNYVSIDPVVRTGLTSLVPLDWAKLPRSAPLELRFFGESREFGVGRQGLLFPVRGLNKDVSILSINSDVGDREWSQLKPILMRDFQILATFFHEGVLKARGNDAACLIGRVSPREIECLKWAGDGKTAWETSVILGISERCVRFHLDQARLKLNCLTKVQAVARAVSIGLITLS